MVGYLRLKFHIRVVVDYSTRKRKKSLNFFKKSCDTVHFNSSELGTLHSSTWAWDFLSCSACAFEIYLMYLLQLYIRWHHLQAEGHLLWVFTCDKDNSML